MSGITLRPPRIADAGALARIWVGVCRYYAEMDPEAFQVPKEDGLVEWFVGFLGEPSPTDGLSLVAEIDGEVVGSIEARLIHPIEGAERQLLRELGDKRLSIETLTVERDHWQTRSGVGSALMEAAEAWAKERGATRSAPSPTWTARCLSRSTRSLDTNVARSTSGSTFRASRRESPLGPSTGDSEHAGKPIQREGYASQGVEGRRDGYWWVCIAYFEDFKGRVQLARGSGMKGRLYSFHSITVGTRPYVRECILASDAIRSPKGVDLAPAASQDGPMGETSPTGQAQSQTTDHIGRRPRRRLLQAEYSLAIIWTYVLLIPVGLLACVRWKTRAAGRLERAERGRQVPIAKGSL
jgi:ribosomal protein S18 acetylase RimI-like enzyme